MLPFPALSRSLIAGLLALLAGLQTACVRSGSLVRPDFRAAAVDELLFISPIAAVGVIEGADSVLFNRGGSAESARLLRQTLLAHRQHLRLRGELPLPDTLRSAVSREVFRAVAGVQRHRRLSGGADLPVLDYLLRGQPQRYLLVTAAQGFKRENRNYQLQMIKALGANLLPGSRVIPVRFESDIHVFIYDGHRRQIIFYNRTPPHKERDPLDQITVEEQLRGLLLKDFPALSD